MPNIVWLANLLRDAARTWVLDNLSNTSGRYWEFGASCLPYVLIETHGDIVDKDGVLLRTCGKPPALWLTAEVPLLLLTLGARIT